MCESIQQNPPTLLSHSWQPVLIKHCHCANMRGTVWVSRWISMCFCAAVIAELSTRVCGVVTGEEVQEDAGHCRVSAWLPLTFRKERWEPGDGERRWKAPEGSDDLCRWTVMDQEVWTEEKSLSEAPSSGGLTSHWLRKYAYIIEFWGSSSSFSSSWGWLTMLRQVKGQWSFIRTVTCRNWYFCV